MKKSKQGKKNYKIQFEEKKSTRKPNAEAKACARREVWYKVEKREWYLQGKTTSE